jgi:Fe-S-cluster containining protein
MDFTKIEIDGEKGRVIFRGDCLEVLPVCQGFCCRVTWDIPITLDEYTTGLYEVEKYCLLTDKECEREVETCLNMRYRLKKNKNGACIHQDRDNKCSIHENKPRVCREFSCRGGWRLGSVFPADDENKSSNTKMKKEDFIERVRDDLTFVLHPLLKIHTVFYLKKKKKIVFVKEMVGNCGKFHTSESFHNPKLNDEMLFGLIHLFGKKDTLQDLRQRFCKQCGVHLEKQEFYEIVWLLNKHQIILDSKNFQGMLGGVGRI